MYCYRKNFTDIVLQYRKIYDIKIVSKHIDFIVKEQKKSYQNINELQMIFVCSSYYLFAKLLRGVIKNFNTTIYRIIINDTDIKYLQ